MIKLPYLLILLLFGPFPASAQKPVYEVYALQYASVSHPLPSKFLVLNAPDKDSMKAVFAFWLIKGNNGKNVMVDAGFLPDVDEAKYFAVSAYTRPDSMLPRVGLSPADITDIILTHPHWDHMDAVDLFPKAKVWIQKDDYGFAVGDSWQKTGADDFNKRDVRKLLELNLAGKLVLVDGDNKEIIPGIKVYTGSRHTFNSQYVLVSTGSDKIILASDNVYSYYNLDHLVSAPRDACYDTAAYVKSMVRMKTLVTNIRFIIPGHDALLFSRFPVVMPGVVKIK